MIAFFFLGGGGSSSQGGHHVCSRIPQRHGRDGAAEIIAKCRRPSKTEVGVVVLIFVAVALLVVVVSIVPLNITCQGRAILGLFFVVVVCVPLALWLSCTMASCSYKCPHVCGVFLSLSLLQAPMNVPRVCVYVQGCSIVSVFCACLGETH